MVLTVLQAQKQNMTYPGYVWIIQGWYSDQWWMEEDSNCTSETLESFLNGTIGVSHFPTASNENQTTDIGIVSGYHALYCVKILQIICQHLQVAS